MAEALITAAVGYVIGGISGIVSGSDLPEMSPAYQALTGTPVDRVGPDAFRFEPLNTNSQPGGAMRGLFGRRRIGGQFHVLAGSRAKTNGLLVFANWPISSFEGIYLDDQLVTVDGSGFVTSAPWKIDDYQSSVFVRLFDGTQTAASAEMLANFSGYSAAHVGANTAYAHIIFDTFTDRAAYASVYSGSTPDVTADVRGFACYDPRQASHDPDDMATWAFTENAALIAANYVIHPLGMRLPHSRVDWASVEDAAATCDETVAKIGGTEPRYRAALAWLTSERHEDVLARAGAAMAGGVQPVGKSFRVVAAAPKAATDAFVPGSWVGPVTYSDTPSLDGRPNGVRGQFTSPDHGFEVRDFPAYQDAAALAADGGVERWLDLPDLSAVTSHTQAQRLARTNYVFARHGAAATFEVSLDHADLLADDVVTVTEPMLGIDAVPFRVVSEQRDREAGTIRVQAVKELANAYAWTPATDERPFIASPEISGISGSFTVTLGARDGFPGGVIYSPARAAPFNILGALILANGTPAGAAWSIRDATSGSILASGTVTAAQANEGIISGVALQSLGATAVVGSKNFEVTFGGSTRSRFVLSSFQAQSYAGSSAANSTVASPPHPASLRVLAFGSGSADLLVRTPVRGRERAFYARLFESTQGDFSDEELIAEIAAFEATHTVVGDPGDTKYYRCILVDAVSGLPSTFPDALAVHNSLSVTFP